MPMQPSITYIRSWFDFTNQLAPFLAMAPVKAPFRELLKKPTTRKVYWGEELNQKFHQAIEKICQISKDGLAYYDHRKPATVINWSKEGSTCRLSAALPLTLQRCTILLQGRLAPCTLWQLSPQS